MKNELYKNKEWLKERYALVGTSTIAKECGVNDATIIYFLRKFKIKIRTRSESLSITKNRKYTINEEYFKKINSEEKAYWLGFLMADATMREYRENHFIFSLELSSTDKAVVEKFIKDVDYTGKAVINELHKKGGGNRVRFFIANQAFCKNLLNYGICPHKTGKETFPNINPKYYRDFIRGFFDGDGCIIFNEYSKKRARGKFHMVSCSYSILSKIKDVLENNNIKFSNKALSPKGDSDVVWELETSSFKNINAIFKFLYYENCICLKRKSDKFKLFNNYYINRSRNCKFKNFNIMTERYSPSFTEM